MLLKYHFAFTLIFCMVLFPFIQWWTIIVFLSGFLIDADHYLYYILKKRDFSLRKAYQNEVNCIERDKLHVFHTIEFYLLTVALSTLNIFFLFILLGISFHLIFDLMDLSLFPNKRGWRANGIYVWLKRH